MSESSRRKRSSPKAATKKRSDQRSDPKKLQYKVRRRIPAPSLHKPESNGRLHDEQLAMPFVVPKRITELPVKLSKAYHIPHDRLNFRYRCVISCAFIL